MRKIPTLFVRDPADPRHVIDSVTPGCEWVLAGEGRPIRKYDGTCVMLDTDSRWWARREVKPGKQPPGNFVPVEHDETTGKTVGWEPIGQSPFARFHAEALSVFADPAALEPGSYELVGPKINANPERLTRHALVRHDTAEVLEFEGGPLPVDFEPLAEIMLSCLGPLGIEGVVWHHPDGRMAKLKVRDFK